jgi:hypothetical protein
MSLPDFGGYGTWTQPVVSFFQGHGSARGCTVRFETFDCAKKIKCICEPCERNPCCTVQRWQAVNFESADSCLYADRPLIRTVCVLILYMCERRTSDED